MRKASWIAAFLLCAPILVPSPAYAATTGTVAFIGKMLTGSPICHVVKVVTGCPQASPKTSVPFVLSAPNSHLGIACVGVAASPKKPDAAAADTSCSVNMSGNLDGLFGFGPWCSNSTGSGISGGVSINLVNPPDPETTKNIVLSSGSFIAVGQQVGLVTGTASKGSQNGIFAGIIKIHDDLTKGHSCSFPPGARNWIIYGILSFSILGNK